MFNLSSDFIIHIENPHLHAFVPDQVFWRSANLSNLTDPLRYQIYEYSSPMFIRNRFIASIIRQGKPQFLTKIELGQSYSLAQGNSNFPFLNMLAIANIPREVLRGKDFNAFLPSCTAMIALIAIFGMGIFTNLVFSNPILEHSLMIYNAASYLKQ